LTRLLTAPSLGAWMAPPVKKGVHRFDMASRSRVGRERGPVKRRTLLSCLRGQLSRVSALGGLGMRVLEQRPAAMLGEMPHTGAAVEQELCGQQ
jgi:hypothetical protein